MKSTISDYKNSNKKKTNNEDSNDLFEWVTDENGDRIMKAKRKVTIDDLEGFINLGYPTDAVELKREIYR